MPLQSRIFVKTSLVALVMTFLWGGAMALAESAGTPFPRIWAVEHAHLAFVGWLVNVVMGFALWMLPLARETYPATAGRYPPRLPYVIYALLNGGLVLRIVSEPMLSSSQIAQVGLSVGGVAQVLAVLLFVAVAWQRVRTAARPVQDSGSPSPRSARSVP